MDLRLSINTQSFSELEIDAMCCVWPDEGGYLYIYRCCGASGGGGGVGWGKHDGYRHVEILLCMDISSIIKILNNFQGPLGFFTCWNRAYLMYDIVVDKRLHGVLEVKDMQDGKNVDKISLPARASDQ